MITSTLYVRPWERPTVDAAWMMTGFPSYCTGSLMLITSSITNGICSRIGLRHFLQTHPRRQPNLVRLRYVPTSSYRFLQTPPLASDALANRILFPVNGARSVASTDWVCQLRWAKIGIGGDFAVSLLPHHRAYGSVPRRFGWLNFGFRLV